MPIDGPADHLSRIQIQHGAAIERALGGWVLGDVGEPQLVGLRSSELALDQVLTGRCVLEVLHPLLWSRQALNAQLGHDLGDLLLVHDEPMLKFESRPDPQTSVGATGALVNVRDGVGQQQVSDVAVGRLVELVLVIGRSIDADDLAAEALGVTQVVQPSDNLELPFGSVLPSSKRSLAALVAFSSFSSSLMRRRAWRRGSKS